MGKDLFHRPKTTPQCQADGCLGGHVLGQQARVRIVHAQKLPGPHAPERNVERSLVVWS
jgi:hypothetical protein